MVLSYNYTRTKINKISNISNNHIILHYIFTIDHTHIYRTINTSSRRLSVLIRILDHAPAISIFTFQGFLSSHGHISYHRV